MPISHPIADTIPLSNIQISGRICSRGILDEGTRKSYNEIVEMTGVKTSCDGAHETWNADEIDARGKTMSDLTDRLKAKIVLEDLSRRTRLLGVLRRDRGSPWWVGIIPDALLAFGVLLVLRSLPSDQAVAILLLGAALWRLMSNYTEGVHKRIDALIELLRQEGSLKREIAPPREEEPKDRPSGERGSPEELK
ncbi:MAG: hypothetical protein ABFE01_24740 [Phycisphaerales bacterium]